LGIVHCQKHTQGEREMTRKEEAVRVTFLGPWNSTFSHQGYNELAKIFGAPEANFTENYLHAGSNREVLTLIQKHGGYGAIAMETEATGRVDEPLKSFIGLLQHYNNIEACPIRVVGAIRSQLHFCLMVRKGLSRSAITKVIAHPQAFGACERRVVEMGLPREGAGSNGEGAQRVAENPRCATYAAIGPRSAAEAYGMDVLEEALEDEEAFTTFFLLAPVSHEVRVGKKNRALIVFKIPHESGGLVDALLPFKQEGLNIIHIDSAYAGKHRYDFAIELDVGEGQCDAFDRAMARFKECVETHLCFGPFAVLSG
jgi:chorismate mutase/prephenate dehydratase